MHVVYFAQGGYCAYNSGMNGDKEINARAFVAFGMAAVCVVVALFILSYTINPDTPEPAQMETVVAPTLPPAVQ